MPCKVRFFFILQLNHQNIQYRNNNERVLDSTKPFELKSVPDCSILQQGYSICTGNNHFGLWVQISKPIIKFSRVLTKQLEHRYAFIIFSKIKQRGREKNKTALDGICLPTSERNNFSYNLTSTLSGSTRGEDSATQ